MGHIKIIIVCLLLAIVVVIPDVVIELLHGLLELVIESAHVLFEIVEVVLDKAVEHTFHTDLHQTQIIVFYIIVTIVVLVSSRLWHLVPRFYQYCKEGISDTKTLYKVQVQDYWQNLLFWQKVKLYGIGFLFLFTALFLFM